MKFTSSVLAAFALKAVATVSPETARDCNVEGNLFQLEGWVKDSVGSVQLRQWGDLGTDSIAVLDETADTKTAVHYINKDNGHLIVLDPFNLLIAANAYTESPEGGELKFTFYNDTSRTYYWPSFSIDSNGHLTVNGSSSIFSHCGSNDTDLLGGTIGIGSVSGQDCHPLDYLNVMSVTSQLSVE
ncbi:hypothetical protein TMatcc_009237 [Talaromyces marneffei ATCC 18224]|uniref:Uncharacterized protein n=1 Tax=Talaromyces marneffei PM1 TaxID=1077442 RepID=A0A093UYH3_TALMA|nr:uncharacterized protein EYB26_008506 [Talaromyces marneffei]KAE8551137.1 hypothetical protein EYB25_007371 [Talaromyces marneffei]QGA20798.1 hypothetical protein EYB26_008506 [Talaromyces marneffei]